VKSIARVAEEGHLPRREPVSKASPEEKSIPLILVEAA